MAKVETERWAGVSSDAVEARTGKGWTAWFKILDKAGAAKLPHKEIAKLLHDHHAVPGWWSQMITVGYEQARGLRVEHQKPCGFEASASKTFPVPVGELFRHCSDSALRAGWLGKQKLTVRKATEPKSMRITWGDATNVEFYFAAKGASKSSVQVQHNKLADEAAVQDRKTFWKAALSKLEARLKALDQHGADHGL